MRLNLKFDRLSIFSLLWAVATLFHIISFPANSLSNPFAWGTAFFALLLLFRPQSVLLLMVMLFFSICKTVSWMPFPPNHIVFELILNIGILIALIYKFSSHFSKKLTPQHREELFNAFAPLTRMALLILYFYAVLHKLNTDYLNPAISCGTVLLNGIRLNGFSFIPDNQFLKLSAIYGTLILESAIPFFLCIRKTRSLGIMLGLALHFFLALHPHDGLVSFSVLLFSMFFLFTPADFPDKLKSTINNIIQGKKQYVKPFLFLALISIILLIFILININRTSRLDLLVFDTWCAWGLFLIVIYLTVTFSENFSDSETRNFFQLKPVFWIFPITIFLNGASPYLGLKTETSFSMFSNLRTEGRITNHLFMPLSLHLTNWQEDLVEIKQTDLKPLEQYIINNQLITFFEFQRIIRKNVNHDFHVAYNRNRKSYKLKIEQGKINSLDSISQIPYLLTKIMHFRPIDKGACLCKH